MEADSARLPRRSRAFAIAYLSSALALAASDGRARQLPAPQPVDPQDSSRIEAPHPAGDYPTKLDPWEVIVYENPGYTGSWARYRLEPGTRQKLVPRLPANLDDAISSYQVGARVGVAMFKDAGFRDDSLFGWYVPFYSVSTLRDRDADEVSSLIVYPLAQGGPLGVRVEDIHPGLLKGNAAFLPLPEREDLAAADFRDLRGYGLDDDINQVQTGFAPPRAPGAPGAPPQADRIRVTLFDERDLGGTSLELPGTAGWKGGPIHLDASHWSDRAASLRVEWVGAPLALGPAPTPTTAHADAPRTIVTEYGINRPGGDYRSLSAPTAEACQAACAKEQACQAFTWVKPGAQGPGGVCWLKSSATRPVHASDCVSGVEEGLLSRLAPELRSPQAPAPPPVQVDAATLPLQRGAPPAAAPAPLPPPAPAPPPADVAPGAELPDIAGTWQSSIGAVYEIARTGRASFAWSAPSLQQTATGEITTQRLTVRWTDAHGGGSALGRVTATDAQGRATRIQWDNGVVFFR